MGIVLQVLFMNTQIIRSNNYPHFKMAMDAKIFHDIRENCCVISPDGKVVGTK